ncbi:MAG: hypothetical protein AB1798_23910, partial [Spirochaetota bacterium]
MDTFLTALIDLPFQFFLSSFSALDLFFRLDGNPVVQVLTEASLVDLAKVFPQLEYPGLENSDAVVRVEEKQIDFSCIDSIALYKKDSFSVLN